MSEEDDVNDDEDDADADRFFLSEQELKLLKGFAADLRAMLVQADPQFIRSAASAILAIERLPQPTPGAHIDVGYRTPNSNGNYGWADLVITEDEVRAARGEHFYDPGVGGDTETRVLFEAGLGRANKGGSLADWFEHAEDEHAEEMSNHAYFYLDDYSEDIDWIACEVDAS
jgi:hypothetical protein